MKVRSPPAVALPASLIKPRPLVALGSPNSRDRWSRDVDCATTGRGFLGRARPLLEKPVRSGAHAAAFVMTFDVALGVVPCALVEQDQGLTLVRAVYKSGIPNALGGAPSAKSLSL